MEKISEFSLEKILQQKQFLAPWAPHIHVRGRMPCSCPAFLHHLHTGSSSHAGCAWCSLWTSWPTAMLGYVPHPPPSVQRANSLSHLKFQMLGLEEMAQWLRMCTVPAESPCLVASSPIRWFTKSFNSSSRVSGVLFQTLGTFVLMYTHRNT